jgi:uncharacterized membrane protein (UPF0127 family)
MLFAALLATILETQASEGCAPDQAKQIQIGGQTFAVEVAASPSERERGLSGRALLKPGTGLWFVFPVPDKYGFWMRDMRFPIDLIWVSPGLKVAGAETLQPAKKNCSIHYAPSRVAYALLPRSHELLAAVPGCGAEFDVEITRRAQFPCCWSVVAVAGYRISGRLVIGGRHIALPSLRRTAVAWVRGGGSIASINAGADVVGMGAQATFAARIDGSAQQVDAVPALGTEAGFAFSLAHASRGDDRLLDRLDTGNTAVVGGGLRDAVLEPATGLRALDGIGMNVSPCLAAAVCQAGISAGGGVCPSEDEVLVILPRAVEGPLHAPRPDRFAGLDNCGEQKEQDCDQGQE